MGIDHGEKPKKKKKVVRVPLKKPKVMNKKNTKTSITDEQKRTQTKKMSAKEKKARASLLKMGYKNPTKAMIDKYSIVFDYDKVFK